MDVALLGRDADHLERIFYFAVVAFGTNGGDAGVARSRGHREWTGGNACLCGLAIFLGGASVVAGVPAAGCGGYAAFVAAEMVGDDLPAVGRVELGQHAVATFTSNLA